MWALWLLLGCPRKAGPPSTAVTDDPDSAISVVRTPIAQGTLWRETGGLCLPIPAGWSGTTGPAPHLIALEHTDSAVRFDVFAWRDDEAPGYDRPGWVLVFQDDDSYRTVPILTPSATATWRRDGDRGTVLQAWRATRGQRTISVEATFPFGHVTSGRDVVDPLLQALCTSE